MLGPFMDIIPQNTPGLSSISSWKSLEHFDILILHTGEKKFSDCQFGYLILLQVSLGVYITVDFNEELSQVLHPAI